MNRACPLCGGTGFADCQFGLLTCVSCDLVVDKVVWRPAANERLNETSFGDDYEPVRSFWVRIFEALNNRRTLSRLSDAVDNRKGRLLEVGVGSGSFLAYTKAHGYFPLGCDLSGTICRRVERSTGISMHCGPLESLPDQQGFDVIVMNHVLEHVSDPCSLLKAALVRLKPGGVLHLAVPNVSAWEARLPGWNCYEPYHLLYFTPQTLRLVAEKAGFEILDVKTHETFSGWFLAIFRTLLHRGHLAPAQRAAHVSVRQPTLILEHGYRLTMVVWGLITLPLRQVQEWLGKGDEAILLGRKNAGKEREP